MVYQIEREWPDGRITRDSPPYQRKFDVLMQAIKAVSLNIGRGSRLKSVRAYDPQDQLIYEGITPIPRLSEGAHEFEINEIVRGTPVRLTMYADFDLSREVCIQVCHQCPDVHLELKGRGVAVYFRHNEDAGGVIETRQYGDTTETSTHFVNYPDQTATVV